MIKDQFYEKLDQFCKENPTSTKNWRLGQKVFNYMCLLYPDAANELRGSAVDPFYNDNMIDEFIKICLSNKEI